MGWGTRFLGLSVAALLGWGSCASARAADRNEPAPIGVAVATAKANYRPGEQVALTVTVTNHADRACVLSAMADGVVDLTLTRNGEAVAATVVHIDYADAYDVTLAARSRSVPPGGSVSFPMAASPWQDAESLRTVTALPGAGGAVAALWPVSGEGDYVATVTYRMPSLKDACTNASGAATVAFAVVAPAKQGSHNSSPVGVWIGVAAGVVLLLVGVFFLVVRRRRRRGTGVAAVVILLAASVTTGAGLTRPAPAAADISLGDAGDTATAGVVAGCKADFAKPGHDPAGIMPFLNGKYRVIVYRETQDVPDATLGDRRGAIVHWHPDNNGQPFNSEPEGAARTDACAELYHELVHAYDDGNGQNNDRTCYYFFNGHYHQAANISEVRATRAENEYRTSRLLPSRTAYGQALPPGTSPDPKQAAKDCNDGKPPPPEKGPKTNHSDVPAPGGTNGDPHLVTFDQRRYDFQAVGEFELAKAGSGFDVQVRQEPLPGSRFVSVNTAVGLRVGADRLSFATDGTAIQARLNGAPATFSGAPGSALPGGGTAGFDSDAAQYVVTWPDGSEADIYPIGVWGLRVLIYPSAQLRGKLTGLLSQPPATTAREQVYGAFADSWRVTDAASLLPYAAGKSTASYTDKTFPDKVITPADLDAGRAEQARAICASFGITDPVALDECVTDLVLTGRPAFAAAAVTGERQIQVAMRSGGTLHDGDVVNGSITTPGQVDTYPLALGDATVLRLADVVGDADHSAAANLTITVDGPDGSDSPGFTVTSNYQYRLKQGAAYTLKVSRSDGATGNYSFRIVTAKERRIPTKLGTKVTGQLDVPGRVDLYTFDASSATQLTLTGATGCDFDVAVVEDALAPHVYSPAGACYGISLASLEPGKHYLLIVWSPDLKTGGYSFTTTTAAEP